MKKTIMPNPVKSHGYIKGYSSSSPRPVKAQATLSDTTVWRSVVDRENLKTTLEITKYHISLGYQQSFYLQFFRRLYTERWLTGQQFWAVDLSPTFLNTGTTDETSNNLKNKTQYIWNFKSWRFFRTTTGIQSRLDAFDELRFTMTSLSILGVTEILCSFRLVLEGN